MIRYRIADISPKVRELIEDAKIKAADDSKKNRLKRVVLIPILLTQVVPLATDVVQAFDSYERVRRSK